MTEKKLQFNQKVSKNSFAWNKRLILLFFKENKLPLLIP